MGCKQITPRRINAESKSGITGNKENTGTAGAMQVKLIVLFQGKVLLEKTYKDDLKVGTVINEINEKIPNYTKDADYGYTVRGVDVGDKADSQIRNLLTASGQVAQGQITEEISVEITLKGLEDLPLEPNKVYHQVELLGKPLSEPFEIAIFEKKTGRILMDTLTEEVINNSEIKVFSDLSAYCNGANHLFISGGEFNNSVILGHFWDFDLQKKSIYRSKSGLITPRKLHSMIYIPNSYVFVVGGLGVKQVECYNIVKKDLTPHSELTEERTEPALALINNSFLYAFSGFLTSNGKTVDSFERINLRSAKKTWELLKPKIADNLSFTQSFFAVSHHVPDEVVFLGGMQSNLNTESCSFVYDYKNNLIKKSSFPHFDMEFSEKSFIPIQEGNNVVLPQFPRENVSIVRYTVQDGLKNIDFETDAEETDRPYNEFTLFQEEEAKKTEFVAKEMVIEIVEDEVKPKEEVAEAKKENESKPVEQVVETKPVEQAVESKPLEEVKVEVKEEIAHHPIPETTNVNAHENHIEVEVVPEVHSAEVKQEEAAHKDVSSNPKENPVDDKESHPQNVTPQSQSQS